MEHISNIFFDLDHTLWDFEKNSALAFESIFNCNSIAVELDAFLDHYVPVNNGYWARFRKDLVTKEDMRLGRLRDTFKAMDYAIDDMTLSVLSDQYLQELPKFNYLFDGAIPVLEYLHSKYNLHIITNGFEEVQALKIRSSHIEHYFKTVTNSESAGCKKPDPAIFDYALKESGADKSNSLMIGDCLEADVNGALNCGWTAIYFSSVDRACVNGITQIHTLNELKKIL